MHVLRVKTLLGAVAIAGCTSSDAKPQPMPVLDHCAAHFPNLPTDQLGELADSPRFHAHGRDTTTDPRRFAVDGHAEKVAGAWNVGRIPASYADFIAYFDGGTAHGDGGTVDLWRSATSIELAHNPVPVFPGTRFLPIGTDQADGLVVIDLDDYYGKGRCAVFLADVKRPDVRYMAIGFPELMAQIIRGPAVTYELMTKPLPPQ